MAMKNCALSLSSSTYKNHIFEGFSRLQQNDEFVDMTLAAEGHLVKVHRTLVALASPYFKELLQSLPCQHPIMFLYGVSHEALGFILEYLYTGQVEIPAEKVKSFLNTAKDMQIAGLKNVEPPDENEVPTVPRPVRKRKHVFRSKYRQPHPAQRDYNTANNPNTSGFQLRAPSIVVPVAEYKDNENKKLFFPVNTPISLEGNNALQSTKCKVPSKMIYTTLDESLRSNDNINQVLRSNKLHNITEIDAPNNMINITLDETVSANNYTNQDLGNINLPINNVSDETVATNDNINVDSESNQFLNISNMNASNEVIHITLGDSAATNDDINQIPTSNKSQSNCNIHAPVKTINITLDGTACTDNISQTPVAKIEILNNTLISHKYTSAGVNIAEQGQLPELYAQALENMNKQDTSTNNEGSIYGNKCTSRSLMEISKLLDLRDDVPMDEDDLLETPAQSKNTEDIVYMGSKEDIDEMVEQSKDTGSILYTISERGALQLIMNRFMYNCHYRRGSLQRQWRCIDYRATKCLAVIHTNGEKIVARMAKL